MYPPLLNTLLTARVPRWDREALAASPVFASIHPLLAALPGDRFPALDDLNALAAERAITSGGGAPLRFVAPAPRNEPYELRIFRDGTVPTRPGSWHDLFNALVWLSFPRTKAVLNRLHVAEIERLAGARERGPVRDVLTLFDESGLVMATSDAGLAERLSDFDWTGLFVERRQEVVARARFYVFGHAVMEKALAPFKGITARTLVIEADGALLRAPVAAQVEALDARAAAHFERRDLLASTRTLSPLPILGIPGWCRENEDPGYYADTTHFRPAPRRPA
jgi:hypothetical protein